MAEEKDIDPPVGTVVTIMGMPIGKSPESVMRAINDISEAALGHFTKVEVAHLPNVPLFTAEVVKNNPDELDNEYLATPVGRAASTVFAGSMRTLDDLEDKKEEARLATMSPEEIEAEEERLDAWAKNLKEEARANTLKEIRQGVIESYEIAEKWAITPNVTAREVAHGVAHDMHAHLAYDYGKPGEYRPERTYPTPSQNYQSYYTEQLADEIKARSIRAAKDLFGEGR